MTRNERIRKHAEAVRSIVMANTRWTKVQVGAVHETTASFVCLDPREREDLLERLRRIEMETHQEVSSINV